MSRCIAQEKLFFDDFFDKTFRRTRCCEEYSKVSGAVSERKAFGTKE
jgi:hypothetical protein